MQDVIYKYAETLVFGKRKYVDLEVSFRKPFYIEI